ncbi:MAG: hypothetical protein JXA58_01600 [Dehalococcoidia bacterium]|nr:hypothetical protein [Dehalococcoidia bacterium]
MNSMVTKRLFWVSWCGATILTGLMAGFLTSHAIMFGRFQTWFIESGNADLLRQTFSVFRAASSPHILYDSFLYVALAAGVVWTVFAFLLKRDRVIAVVAGLSTFWVGAVFFGFDFGTVEDQVMMGIANETTMATFARLNVPLHTFFAAFYVLSLFLLLLVPLKSMGIWKRDV